MTAIRAHFDGKTIVPDEPVDLPKGRPLIIHVEQAESRHPHKKRWLGALRGQIRMSEDFDEPLDDFKDYM